MGLIILICAVISAYLIMKIVSELINHLLPKKKWFTLIGKIVGWGLAFLYLYFSGYFVMDPDVNLLLAWLVGLLPAAVFIVWKVLTHASVMENQ